MSDIKFYFPAEDPSGYPQGYIKIHGGQAFVASNSKWVKTKTMDSVIQAIHPNLRTPNLRTIDPSMLGMVGARETPEGEPCGIMKMEQKNASWAGEVGVIVHWGWYSVAAYDSVASAKRRSTQNGSEWYLKRLMVKPDAFRPCSGWRETQEWHKKHYGSAAYSDFGKSFTASAWRPDEWMTLFKSIGATYAILTAKHHDGVCLWPTKAEDCLSVGRDIVGEFKTAAEKAGLKFGVYYSWGEFLKPATKQYMDKIVRVQIEELIRYAPSVFWFDGDWMCTTKHSQSVIDDCLSSIKKHIPGVLINDRIGNKEVRMRCGDNHLTRHASYRVYADRAIPKSKPTVPWEHVNTIGYSWGYNAQQTPNDYKTPQQIKALYDEVKKLGGRFLINVGPKADGSLDPAETKLLQSLKLTSQ